MRQGFAVVPVLLFAAVGCGSAEGSASSRPTVTFFAEGVDTEAAALTMRSESGGTLQKDVSLPLKDVTTGVQGLVSDQFERGDFLYFSMQNSNGFGSVTCRIVVDGEEVDRATASGGYKIATCQGRVP